MAESYAAREEQRQSQTDHEAVIRIRAVKDYHGRLHVSCPRVRRQRDRASTASDTAEPGSTAFPAAVRQ